MGGEEWSLFGTIEHVHLYLGSPQSPCMGGRFGSCPLGNRRASAWRRGFFLPWRVDHQAEEWPLFVTIEHVHLSLGSPQSPCNAGRLALARSAIGGLVRGGVV